MDIAPFIVIGIVLFIGIAILAWQMDKKRREALMAWGAANGWDYSPGKRRRPGLPFALFRRGSGRYSRDHFEKIVEEATPGLDAAHLDLFEYHYETRDDKNTSHYHFTCALAAPGLDLGRMTIRKEGWTDKIAQAVGFDDIDFEDHEFSKKFVVKAKDRRLAYDVISPRMMEFLLRNRGWSIETEGRKLFVHRRGRPKVEDFEAIADFIQRFLRRIPRTVVNAERQKRGQYPLVEAGGAAQPNGEEE